VTVKAPPVPPEPPFSVRFPFLLLEKEGVTRLTLVRHAQQDYPVEEEFDHAAWADPPLSGLGRTQAMALAAVLGEQDVDVVACSTMRRAIETAEIVASPHRLTPVVRPELVEVLSYRDVPDGVDPQTLVDPDLWASREQAFYREVKWDHMFFGESSAAFRFRAVSAVDRLVADHEGLNIVLVSHGGVINAFLGSILGIEEDMFFLPNHCSISTVWIKGDRRRVHSINERQHLHVGILTN
jgi:2,3-bisphosphoglycerate-dependent phosphoglycerate mutase